MRIIKNLIFAALLAAFFSPAITAQIAVQGSEQGVSYTPPFATLAPPNTPATNFASPGFNTFILSVTPTVSVRVYITNQTANPCLSTFFVAMAVASDRQTVSFNNSINNWQSVPLQSPTGTLVSSVPLDIPASGTVFVSSTAISGPTVAIQVVNQSGGCATTNLEVTVVLTQIAVTSPLVSVSAGGFGSGLTANVQGIVPTGTNGAPVLPVIGGAIQPAINSQFLSFGVDNFGTSSAPFTSGGGAGSLTLTSPTPSKSGEYGLAFIANSAIGVVNTTPIAPWTCIESGCINSSLPSPAQLNLQNNNANNLSTTFSSPLTTGVFATGFLIFNKPPTVRQHTTGNFVVSSVFGSNTLAGSTLYLAVTCSTIPCTIAPTDGQGLSWKNVANLSFAGSGSQGLTIWIAGPSTAAAETVTFNVVSGTINGSTSGELTGTTPANPNQPSSPLLSDTNKVLVTGGNIAGVTDPCGTTVLKSSVPINVVTATTTQLVALTVGQSIYVCGATFTIAPSGTTADTATFEFGTGASCGTGTTALTGALGAGDLTTATGVAVVTFSDPQTTMTAPSGNALCLLSAGTTVNIQGILQFVKQ
jgi:hypothetical protein